VSATAAELERGWRLVESRGPVDVGAIVADPLQIAIGKRPLLVGVDAEGDRHLLIPIGNAGEVGKTTPGGAVKLAARSLLLDGAQGTYADISCSRPDLYDEFAVLASAIAESVAADPAAPAETAARVIEEWRELLRAISLPRLDRSALIGLFAELLVLERILATDPRRRVDCWTGPTRGRHDFQRGEVVLDVKGTTARRGRPVVIHGIDQLEAPPNAELFLWLVRLEVGVGRGDSLRALVERLLDRALDPADLEQKLRRAGYDFDSEDSYETPLLTELETRLYRVDESFPALTRRHLIHGDLPARVTAVNYEIDLSGDEPKPVSNDIESSVLRALGGSE
jgi:hypothetical protein